MRMLFLAALLGAIGAAHAWAQIPAFPGADGAGAYTTGGRGGIVYHVTKLDTKFSDNGPGTLRYGLNNANFSGGQARTIVFDVGGTIWLGRNTGDTEGWDTQDPMSAGSNITIAGQTAPGGINIVGGGLKVNGNNAIIRNLTIAPGYGTRSLNSITGYADSYVYDGMNIHATGVIVDHSTFVFATDEGVSADELANSVTVQYSSISQGQNYPQADAEAPGTYSGHALGSLWQPGSNATTSILHNLYAHQKGRLPRVGTEASKLAVPGTGAYNDFRNNVFYNWLGTGGSGASSQPSANNFVGNFYLAGPGGQDSVSGTDPSITTKAGGTGIFSGSSGPTGVYHSGNLKDTNKDSDALDGAALTNSDFGSSTFQASPYTQVPYYGVTDTATGAYNRVLNYAGANWWSRDTIDARIVNEVRTGTGQITAFNDPTHGTEWNALLGLRSTTNGGIGGAGAYARPAGYDTDGDGMPDAWEKAHGLNANAADNNADFDGDAYTNLEEYLDDLAAFPAPQALVFKTAGGSYEQFANWNSSGSATDMRWQPSRYDEAQINAGVCTLGSVGQHAGTLKIAANSGNTATLNITAGWLKVEQSLDIGTSTSTGTLNLSGGELSVLALNKAATGSFNFTGGKLHAQAVAFNLTDQGGTIAPGDPIGGFDAAGTYAQGSGIGQTRVAGSLTMQSGAIEIELASAASFDKLIVDGNLTAGGVLNVSLQSPYTPALGDSFDVFDWGSQSGAFAVVNLPPLDPGLSWNTAQLYSDGILSVVAVPEPAAIVLLALGGLLPLSRAGLRKFLRQSVLGYALSISWASPIRLRASRFSYHQRAPVDKMKPSGIGRYLF
jgi:hypothetical protein